MIILKIAIIVTAAVIDLFILARNTDRWARSLQKYYVDQSRGNAKWDEPWRLILFKALVVFFGLMAALGVYVAVLNQ